MTEQIRNPKLRFRDNKGNDYSPWNLYSIKDVAKMSSGKSKKNENKGRYIIMDMGTVTKNGTMLTHKSTPYESDLLNKGDLVMVKDDIGGGHIIGKTIFIPESQKYVLGDHVYRLEPKNYDGLFLHYCINSPIVNRSLKRKVTGSAQLGLNRKSVEEELIKIPSLEEQEKIGGFFSKLDRQIELEEQKLKKLEEQKKGYMQKIFSQELQFRDKITNNFDNWSEFKIKDIFSKIESGNRLPKNNLLDGDIPYVIAQTTNNGVYMNISKDTLDYHGNNLKKFKKGSITISIDNPDAMFIQAHDFVTSNVMRVLYNENLSIEAHTFILYSLRKLTQTYNWSVKFSGPIIMDSKIKLPVKLNTNDIDWDIVNKIGEFLNKLDFKIYQNTTKVELLRQRKHGLLQKMFV